MQDAKNSRRGFLKGAVVGGTAAATAATPLATLAQTAPKPAALDAPAGYVFLMPTEATFIEAVADHMFPANDKTPGGVDIGIAVFIDRALAGS